MTDQDSLVQRLRTRAEAKRRHRAEGNDPPVLYGSPRLDDEAADEIERLRDPSCSIQVWIGYDDAFISCEAHQWLHRFTTYPDLAEINEIARTHSKATP